MVISIFFFEILHFKSKSLPLFFENCSLYYDFFSKEVENTDANIENDNSSIGNSRSFYRENGVLNELE